MNSCRAVQQKQSVCVHDVLPHWGPMGSFHGAQTSDPFRCQGLDNVMDRAWSDTHTHTLVNSPTLLALVLSLHHVWSLYCKNHLSMSFNLMFRLQIYFSFNNNKKKGCQRGQIMPLVPGTAPRFGNFQEKTFITARHENQDNDVFAQDCRQVHLYSLSPH